MAPLSDRPSVAPHISASAWDASRPDEVSKGEFTDWYVKSEQRVEADLEQVRPERSHSAERCHHRSTDRQRPAQTFRVS
jgi:hypothetical protein